MHSLTDQPYYICKSVTKVGVLHENARISRRIWRKLISLRSIMADYISDHRSFGLLAIFDLTVVMLSECRLLHRPRTCITRTVKANFTWANSPC